MGNAFDDGTPDNVVVNANFPGLELPSKYDSESGRPDPNKPILIVTSIWLFKGVGGVLSDRWFMLTRNEGEIKFWSDVIGARYMLKNGGRNGVDVETTFLRVQGWPDSNPDLYLQM